MTKVYSEPYKVPGFSNSRLECRVRYTALSLLVPTSANNWKLSLFNVLFYNSPSYLLSQFSNEFKIHELYHIHNRMNERNNKKINEHTIQPYEFTSFVSVRRVSICCCMFTYRR